MHMPQQRVFSLHCQDLSMKWSGLPVLQVWICSSGLGVAVAKKRVLCKLHEGRVVYGPEGRLEAAFAAAGHES